MNNLTEDKYISCMILHAVGDTVGFRNGKWEFKQGSYEKTLEKVYEYIDLGGVTGISLKDWDVSDDTILHMQTCDALIQDWKTLNSYMKILKDNFLQAFNQFEKEGWDKRAPGITTLESIKKLKEGVQWEDISYNLFSGGSGASMRNLCIGLAFHGENNRDKLIQFSIESSRMTHNSVIGYLGGFVSALFSAFAVEGIRINDWPFILLEMFRNNHIEAYIEKSTRGLEDYKRDHHVFVEKWTRYIEDKFDDDRNPIKRRSSINLVSRGKYYEEAFGFKKELKNAGENYSNAKAVGVGYPIGAGGDDSVIIAYDALIDSGDSWEKLVYYGMLHMGDTDTTGCIAAGLYGILHGTKNVPKNFLEHLEYKEEITDLGKKLYKKFK